MQAPQPAGSCAQCLARKIRQGGALTATSGDGGGLLGGLLFTANPPAYHVRWLVVSEQVRGKGVGQGGSRQVYRKFVT